jgi:hypothetical protein
MKKLHVIQTICLTDHLLNQNLRRSRCCVDKNMVTGFEMGKGFFCGTEHTNQYFRQR